MNKNGSKSRPERTPRNFIASHLLDVPPSGIREFFDIVSSRKDVISLGIGEPDFVTPWHIREAAMYALDCGATSYTSNRGLESLRNSLSAYVKEAFNVVYNSETEILVTVGVSEALDMAIRAVVNPGDEVLYHEPCYVCYAPLVQFAHGKAVAVGTTRDNGFRLTREMLEKKVTDRTKALLLNFPTNPTGAVVTREDLKGIADFAIEHDIVVITDEIYSELTFDGERLSIAALPGMKERTVFLHGFSKAWAMTGFRLGYACAPPDLIETMVKIHQYAIMCAPILSQKAAVEALHKHSRADVEEMRCAYEERRNFIWQGLNEIGLSCHKPSGAFYAFPYIGNFGMASRDFALKLLNEQNVACVPGTAFGPSGEGYLRCSFSTDLDDIKEAVRRIGLFVKKL
ncbi:MAG: aminotransferase class I/II-fold pyridoxal phosphate-dependent enzyme [bacterium]